MTDTQRLVSAGAVKPMALRVEELRQDPQSSPQSQTPPVVVVGSHPHACGTWHALRCADRGYGKDYRDTQLCHPTGDGALSDYGVFLAAAAPAYARFTCVSGIGFTAVAL